MKLVDSKKLHLTYVISEQKEAGIELFGYEVKSLRKKLGSLDGAKVIVRGGEAFLVGAYIPPFQPANTPKSYDPYRTRKLLFNKDEIVDLYALEQSKTLTIAPHSLYLKNNLIKCEVAVCKKKILAISEKTSRKTFLVENYEKATSSKQRVISKKATTLTL